MSKSYSKISDLIRQNECTTKEEVIKRINKKIKKYASESENNPYYPATYYALMKIFLIVFLEKVENSILMDYLPDFWVYKIEYNYDEFSLNLEHFKKYEIEKDGSFKSGLVDAIYKLVLFKPTALNVDQYAKLYDVEQGTVRQWIRRGKLRTVYKEGNEWKIPQLSLPPSKGYEPAQYKWFDGIENLPEEYSYLNKYVLATFFQDRKDKTKYHVLFVSKEKFSNYETTEIDISSNEEIILNAQEREKLELFMISHPQIKYCGFMI